MSDVTFQPALVTDARPMDIVAEMLPDTLDLHESIAKAKESVKAELIVSRDGDNLIVTGTLATTMQLICGRCGVWMPWPLRVRTDQVLEAPHPASIDLTPSLREDILLELPLNAACQLGADGRCPVTGELYRPPPEAAPGSLAGGEVWAALSKIKPKN